MVLAFTRTNKVHSGSNLPNQCGLSRLFGRFTNLTFASKQSYFGIIYHRCTITDISNIYCDNYNTTAFKEQDL